MLHANERGGRCLTIGKHLTTRLTRARVAAGLCVTLTLGAAVLATGATSAMAAKTATPPKPPKLRGLPAPSGIPKKKRGPEAGTSVANAVIPATGRIGTRDTAVTGTWACNYPWVWVASYPSGYVEGNCAQNEQIQATRVSDPADGNYYLGGLIGGNYNGCGWVRALWTWGISTSGGTGCASPSRPACDFMYCSGSTPWIWDDGSGRDGLPVTMARDCILFANYHPWIPGQVPIQPMRLITRGSQIKMRYLTKYPFNAQYFVMVHDLNPAFPAGNGNWGFIPQGCLV